MVTTRSQDRVDASSPAPVNKRRRFDSEDPDDNIVVAVPVREAGDFKAQASSAETESDNEAAPEVISSKDAAQQARALPNRSLGRAGHKRRRITKENAEHGDSTPTDPARDASKAQEQKSTASEAADQATASLNGPFTPAEDMSLEGLQIPEQPAASNAAVPENEEFEAAASAPPAEGLDPSSDVPAQADQKPEPVASLESVAGIAMEDRAPAPEPMVHVTTAPVITDPEPATGTDVQLVLASEAPLDCTEEIRASTPSRETLPSAPNVPAPAVMTAPARVQALHQISIDTPTSQSAKVDPAPSSLPVETTASQQPTKFATPPPVDRVPGTPQSTTSGIITPVWHARTHDTPVGSVTSPSVNPKTKNFGPSRARPRQKLPLHHQRMHNSNPKPTSLQQYRDRLLNRHPRTAAWGPPGFRNTKFVGA